MKDKPAADKRARKTPHEDLVAAFEFRSKRFGNRTADIKEQIRHLMTTTNMTYPEIGKEIGISGMTVYQHVQRMMRYDMQAERQASTAALIDSEADKAEMDAIRAASHRQTLARINANRPRLK